MHAHPGDPPHHRRLRRLTSALLAALIVLGPWPVDDSSFEGSAYQQATLDRLERAPGPEPAGPFEVGTAETDLTPVRPRNLAGFIGQIRSPFRGVDTRCFARALTIKSGEQVLTILTADLLLIDARMAQAVCDRARIRLDEVYFTASHTHGGPGGWGAHPLEMLVAGAYDPDYFAALADQLADVVVRSRTNLEPAELGFVQVQTSGRQTNRIQKGATTHDALSALMFRRPGSVADASPLAILVVFGAHATVSHPIPPRLGGDYPAALASELKRRTGAGMVLFAAGAVGDASPSRPKAASQAESAAVLGAGLADDLIAGLANVRYESSAVIDSLRLAVELPPVRLPFATQWLRFSPLATWWIADRQTHLHAIRLGRAVLVGFPGDYSGHLADRLVASTGNRELATVVTSFDGDYRGYLVSGTVFRAKSCYETRWMNFYGPWAGDYLNDLARRMVDRLSGSNKAKPAHPQVMLADQLSRIALAALMILGLVAAIMRRELSDVTVARFGFVSTATCLATLLAFELDPDLVAWANFSQPAWFRFVGLAVLAWVWIRVARRSPQSSNLLFGLACGLLASSWLVILLMARAWARSGLNDAPQATSRATTAS